jgi:hypothetical protein
VQPPAPLKRVPVDDRNAEYIPLTPLVKTVKYLAWGQPRHMQILDANDTTRFHPPLFSSMLGRQSGLPVDPMPSAMVELYFPDSMLEDWCEKTMAYAASHLPPSKLINVTPTDMCNFLSMYYYMGIVRLPAKKDYWRSDHSFWPIHPPAQLIKEDLFMYIWHNFHLLGATQDGMADEEVNIDEEEEDDPEDITDEEDNELDEEEEEEEELEDVEVENDTRWYKKVASFLEHVMEISWKLCIRPSTTLSIDKMMKLFKGWSGHTHRMKNKPIKQGYKFFAICDAKNGYVWPMVPDGQLEKLSTHDYVVILADTLPEPSKYNYVITMDNYFTWPRVMESLADRGIGALGTARFQRGCPPKEYRNIKEDQFNCVHLMNDVRNYRIMRWVDNNVVTMVTNCHIGDEVVARERKRPRQTATNKTHLRTVWGDDPVKIIEIPKAIDDYNHWMNGVDKADQLIAYYRPKLRC